MPTASPAKFAVGRSGMAALAERSKHVTMRPMGVSRTASVQNVIQTSSKRHPPVIRVVIHRHKTSFTVIHASSMRYLQGKLDTPSVLSRMGFLRSTLICPLSGDLFE
jgi:hypothetical protein